MPKVKLIKLRSTHDNLRTNEIDGHCDAMPKVGARFYMTAPPIDPTKEGRYVLTSEVKDVKNLPNETKFVFETQNSTYRLEVIG